MAKLRVSFDELRNKLAGRVLLHPGKKSGELVVEVPGEGAVLRHFLECLVDGDNLIVTAAYREDIYGTHDVSLTAVAAWLKKNNVSFEVLEP